MTSDRCGAIDPTYPELTGCTLPPGHGPVSGADEIQEMTPGVLYDHADPSAGRWWGTTTGPARPGAGKVPSPAPDDDVPDPDEAPEGWAVEGVSRAARTLARCRLLRAELAEVRALAQAEIDRWQEWATGEETRIGNRLDWYEEHLRAFAQEARRRDPENGKTVNLPGGKLSTKEQAGKWVVDPESALASAAELRPDLIDWRPRFDLAAAKRTLRAVDGQVHDTRLGVVIEGVTPEPDRIAVTITYLED